MGASFDPRPSARRFWERVGHDEPFPRRLQKPIATALPIAIVKLPLLDGDSMSSWMRRRNIVPPAIQPGRRLRGCLVASRGNAVMFLDGTMNEAEERHTIAHELSHFLLHYEAPREFALAVLGPEIVAVLDGDRSATTAERLAGALRAAPLGVFTDLLDRDHRQDPAGHVARAEIEADLLAFELIAPSARVLRTTMPGDERVRELVETFGMPAWAATAWAAWVGAHDGKDPLTSRLRAAALQKARR